MKNYQELLTELTRRIDSDREGARARRSAFVAEGNTEASAFNHGASSALSIVLGDIKQMIVEVETSKSDDVEVLECEICQAEMTQDDHNFCDICGDCREEMDM